MSVSGSPPHASTALTASLLHGAGGFLTRNAHNEKSSSAAWLPSSSHRLAQHPWVAVAVQQLCVAGGQHDAAPWPQRDQQSVPLLLQPDVIYDEQHCAAPQSALQLCSARIHAVDWGLKAAQLFQHLLLQLLQSSIVVCTAGNLQEAAAVGKLYAQGVEHRLGQRRLADATHAVQPQHCSTAGWLV